MSPLGRKVIPPKPAAGPEWIRDPSIKGMYRHRDPPFYTRFAPDAWEQAAATLEDNAKAKQCSYT